jgi:tRNA threonylcarbamoyladenosine biosynthesis protein TsaB
MNYIYVDSTSILTIGLLDANFNWIEYLESKEKKPSEVIHLEIYRVLKKHNLKVNEIEFFFNAGPGSYTGMRLSEGLAQILEWDFKSVYSFFHFEVPKMIGIKNGYWVTNAFKKQVFLFEWDQLSQNETKALIDDVNFKVVKPENGYTLMRDKEEFKNLTSTIDLIKEHSQTVFSIVHKNKKREAPYYFRSLEEEFK